MHIGAVMLFDAPPDRPPPTLAELREHLQERVAGLPRYRERLSEPHTGGLTWPSWEHDPAFTIAEHVHHATLPAPGGDTELLDWASGYWSQRLDRRRPLWDVVLVDGLEHGRWALATKTHHCLVDGIGSVDIAHTLLDTEPEPAHAPTPPPPAAPPEEHHASALWRLPSVLVHGTRAGIDTALHPGRLVEMAGRARAMTELIVKDEVIGAPKTSVNGPIGTLRRFEVVRVRLEDLKEIKRALGGTVNDVVLAATTGGLRRLLVERGERPPPQGLRAMVPVNVRAAGEQMALGNRITSLFVSLPVDEPDAARRYERAAAAAEELKSGTQAKGGSTLIDLAGLAPPVLHSVVARSLFASRLFNVTVTNVPGPQQPLYAFGGRMREVFPLVPIAADHAVGIAVVSYAGEVVFGINVDRDTVPDVEALVLGIEDTLDELLALARAAAPAGTR
jgi:WS/DGAT/MGAT family acyltransferase